MKKLTKMIGKVKKLDKFTIFNYEKVLTGIINKYSKKNDNYYIKTIELHNFHISINVKEMSNNEVIEELNLYILVNQSDFQNIYLEITELNKNFDKRRKVLILENEMTKISRKEKLNKGDLKHLLALKTEINLLKKDINIISVEGGSYISNENNIYQYIDKKSFNKIILDNCGFSSIQMEDINEVRNKLILKNFIPNAKFDNVNVREEIVFNNCIYNFVTNKTRKIELEDLIITFIDSPFHLLDKKLEGEVSFEEGEDFVNHKPKMFMEFLENAITDDEIEVLQEFMGYTFKMVNDHKNFLVLKGVKNSGKSTINDILQKIIGNDNICSVRPKDLESPERSYSLKGSLLNLVPELRAKEQITDDIKKITSGGADAITVRRRFEQEETIIPVCKTVITTNHELCFKDDASGAIEVRTILIDFKKSVPLHKINKNIVNDILSKEQNKIINWCIDGLRRLEKRGHFDKTLDNKSIIFNKRKNDNLTFKYLVENIKKFEGREYYKFEEFREEYNLWLEKEGYDFQITKKSLTGNLKLLNIETKDTRRNNERSTFILFKDSLESIKKQIDDNRKYEEVNEKETLELLAKIEEEQKRIEKIKLETMEKLNKQQNEEARF